MSRRLSTAQRLAYGSGDIGFNLFFQTASLYLLFYYTEVLGLSAAAGGWIFAAALIWDAITDPIMGYLASRTRTRWGRYRPWVLFGAAPLGLSWVAMFVPMAWEGTALIAFALATHILFRTLYTIVGMPYLSLSAAMTADSGERGTLASLRMIGATATGLFAALMTLKLVGWLGGGDARAGWLIVAMLYAGAATLILTIAALVCREDMSVAPEAIPSLADMVRMLRANRAFWLIAGWLWLASFASTLFGKTLPYLFKYGYEREEAIGLALGGIAAMAMLGVVMWTAVMRRTSKRFILVAGGLTSISGYTLFWLADGGTMMWFAIALLGIGGGAGALGFWATVPDTVEVGEFRTGVRAEGILFGVIAFVQKAALGLSVGLLGEILSAIGYAANQPQTPETIAAMKALMVIGPATCIVIALGFAARYPVDARMHARLRRALAWRAGRR